MKSLSIGVGLFGILALVVAVTASEPITAVLGATALLCAVTTFNASAISSFLQIFIGIFSTETIIFGLAVLADQTGLWPAAFEAYTVPESLPLSVAVFSILVYLAARLPAVRQVTRIADRYFEAANRTQARIWPFPRFGATEGAVAVGLVVFLVLLNQLQVGVTVRLSFFTRDWLNAVQNRDAAAFWQQLLLVFTPWVFAAVAAGVVEFFARSVLVVRWRRWLTNHLIERWLASHAHYHISLSGTQADNPDQRIQEDVARFINGGNDGSTTAYGLYSFSLMLIQTVSTVVSFSIVLWDISDSFMLPGTDIKTPGLLFWAALVYAVVGTLVSHRLGRPMIGLFFERQHQEANFRFALARLREYTEQVALIGGEDAERSSLGRSFGAVVANFMALAYRRMKLLAFTQSFVQTQEIIPYVLTAPFFFAGQIQFGSMSQAADGFKNVADALTFFVNYYTELAGFKSVVDRLSSFDDAIENAHRLAKAGPQHLPAPAGAAKIDFQNVDVALPDGRHTLSAPALTLAAGENVLLSGPSGAGKLTLFRSIGGIWPYGGGSIRVPEGARVMVVPQKPYIPIAPLRDAVAYPSEPGAYGDDAIRKALEDVRLSSLASQLDREDVWSQRLSGGEQQRVALARALLMRPDWLFLDESTSALDEKLEAEMYALLDARLPATTIISIGHRSTLNALHHRRLDMTSEGEHFALRDDAKVAAE